MSTIEQNMTFVRRVRKEVAEFAGLHFAGLCSYGIYSTCQELSDNEFLHASEDDAKMFALFVAEAIEQGDL